MAGKSCEERPTDILWLSLAAQPGERVRTHRPDDQTEDECRGRPSPAPTPIIPPKIEENLARYLKSDGSLARAFIAYNDIAAHCDTRLFETTIPLIGQRTDLDGAGTTITTLPVGELVLQLFRLPPLRGVPPTQLPQSLDECLRGLRHVSWH